MKSRRWILSMKNTQLVVNFITSMRLMVSIGYATGEKITRLSPGMSQSDVNHILGKPDGFWDDGDYTVLKYTNNLISGWSWVIPLVFVC